MKSKVISVRIPVDTLASCVNLLSKAGLSPKSMSLSAIIKTVCQAAVNQAIKANQCFQYDEEDASDFLSSWGKEVDIIEIPTGFDMLSSIKDVAAEEEKDKEEQPESASAIAKQIRESTQPSIGESELTINENVVEDDHTADLYKLDFTPLSELVKIAPKDILIESFNNTEVTEANKKQKEIYQRCMEVIYHKTAVGDWGTESTQISVSQLYSNYQ